MRSFGVLFALTGGSGGRPRRAGSARRSLTTTAILAAFSFAPPAFAQTPAGAPGAAPGTVPNAPPPPARAAQPTRPPQPTTPPQPATPTTPTPGVAPTGTPDVPRPSSGGEVPAGSGGTLNAETVGQRAAQTSFTLKAAEQNLTAAGARAEQQWSNYLPRVGLVARYTRLSEFAAPSFSEGGFIVGTRAPPGTINPSPTQAVDFSFPLVFDNYLLQATIAIPISDYFLRIGKSYTASTLSEDAARFDVVAARAKSYADGKVAYYTWLRSRGAIHVAEQTLAVAQAHQKDADNQFAVGNASKADVLRAQTQVASGELLLERAKSGYAVTERQVRVAMHAKDEEVLTAEETLGTLPPAPTSLRPLITEALGARPEIKSIDKNAEAARKRADVQRAGRLPVLSGFGDATYANPNQRRFPQTSEWFPTWSLGAQVTWSPNDVVVANAAGADYEARATALDAQKSVIRDGIELEVTSAYQDIIQADAAIVSTQRQLDSAVEGYRVARELFNNGRGTATTLIDAEIVLAQTRFERLNALADARIARVRLEHALGRDAKQ
jgi:outer membrane protein TolC